MVPVYKPVEGLKVELEQLVWEVRPPVGNVPYRVAVVALLDVG